jgi:hypothetical protein
MASMSVFSFLKRSIFLFAPTGFSSHFLADASAVHLGAGAAIASRRSGSFTH